MKRILVSLLLVAISFLFSFANDKKEIMLNESDHTSAIVELRHYNIFVSLIDVDINGNAEISIELENISETYTLMLFDYAYSEKLLKKARPVSIRFYKYFDGSKTNPHVIIPCQRISRSLTIPPSGREYLFNMTGNRKDPFTCTISVYRRINKNKKGTKAQLVGKSLADLSIQIQPDSDYFRIQQEYQDLMDDLESETFCTNRYHKGTPYETLKSQYTSRIQALKREIGDIVKSRNYRGYEKSYEKYKILLDRLDRISIESRIVSQCPYDEQPTVIVTVTPPPPLPSEKHHCKYCSLSYAQIYDQFDNYLIDLYNGKTTKSKIIKDVEALYRCFLNNHSRVDKNGYRKRITEYYNRIKSY